MGDIERALKHCETLFERVDELKGKNYALMEKIAELKTSIGDIKEDLQKNRISDMEDKKDLEDKIRDSVTSHAKKAASKTTWVSIFTVGGPAYGMIEFIKYLYG